jgi:peptidoglycan/LPS O-acetylase OafA/YrhL
MTPKYRPDIDGLRAVAVLSIVLFHVGVKHFTGGYVGVDGDACGDNADGAGVAKPGAA